MKQFIKLMLSAFIFMVSIAFCATCSADSFESQKNYSAIDADNYGYSLGKTTDGSEFWWCEGAWNVGELRKVPETKITPIQIKAAKGEYEPAQLVIHTANNSSEINEVRCSDLVNGKNILKSSNVSLYEVMTVNITKPFDYLGRVGNYPDPLPPLNLPISITANQNKAIWVSVFVPNDTKAGLYKGIITVKLNNITTKLPIELKVFNFAISEESHLRSAFGLGSRRINAYHKLQTPEQINTVWDLYMQNFSKHRISPYKFASNADIKISFTGEGLNKRVVLDFTDFDKAGEKNLDKLHFNSFRLNLAGLGNGDEEGGTPGEMDGYKDGTPEYEMLIRDYLSQLEKHLIEKNWIDKAVAYWFDEPTPRDYPFVVKVNDRIKKYAPRIRRLLTEQPEKELIGHVDIWSAITQNWTKEALEDRVKAGDEVWWYICTAPKAPYIGEFMEHPAVEMRLWPWQSWQYNVSGILIWETTFWTSPNVFPNSLQDPFKDPASYVDKASEPKGSRRSWGNGDGRYIYPPLRDPNTSTEPSITGPINSTRWENLRDGMEDYEYLWMLKHLISKKSDKISAKLLGEAKALLVVPENVSKNMTQFNFDPRPLLEHRSKVALMIEKLQNI